MASRTLDLPSMTRDELVEAATFYRLKVIEKMKTIKRFEKETKRLETRTVKLMEKVVKLEAMDCPICECPVGVLTRKRRRLEREEYEDAGRQLTISIPEPMPY